MFIRDWMLFRTMRSSNYCWAMPSPVKTLKPLAKDLLKNFGGLKAVLDAEPSDLLEISGVGAHTTVLIKLVKELNVLYLKEKAKEKVQISCTSELLDYCKTRLGGLKDEHFCVIYLDAQNQLIEMEQIQQGIVNQAVVYPRQVLETALRRKASAMILVHNHPSGHVKPSDADIRLTQNDSRGSPNAGNPGSRSRHYRGKSIFQLS